AGLNSIVALSGLGMAYIHLTNDSNRLRNALLVLSLLPIALFANVIRVAALALITYHFSDDAGQRFHDIAGITEVLFALGAFFALDSLIGATRIGKSASSTNTAPLDARAAS